MTVITSSDKQKRLIALVQADALFQSSFAGKTIQRTDPDGVEPSADYSVAIELAGSGLDDGSLGESGIGTDELFTQVVVLVYVYSEDASESRKDVCVDTTETIGAIIRKFQSASVQGRQYWYRQEFVKRQGGLATTYHWRREGHFYVSITAVNLYSRETRL
jgi:hypothetical protein